MTEMTFPAVSWHFFIITLVYIILVCGGSTVLAENQQHHGSSTIRDNPGLRPRRRSNKACPDGYEGINCKDNINECNKALLPYPCTDGVQVGSFCVDFDPPEKFKCGCRPGYDAVLPDERNVTDPVPIEWRPLKCVPRDVCVDFLCHEDATCSVSTSNEAVCICNDNLVGDGITDCSPPPKTVATKPPQNSGCKVDSDCSKIENSICVVETGVCQCKAGFYQSSGKGQCINENECADGFPNDCHQNADCTDMEGSYTCACKDGYQDVNSNDKPGTKCAQINECLDPSIPQCNTETQVCVDLPPPAKWQCVERTPAPTPTPVCDDTGVTAIVRSSTVSDPTTYFDSALRDCAFMEPLSSFGVGFCNCRGIYVSKTSPGETSEIIIPKRRGAALANVCCYCRGRQDEVCNFEFT